MIGTYLEISTCHLTEDTRELLEDMDGADRYHWQWPAMTVATYEYGFFLTVPDFDDPDTQGRALNLPDDLYAALLHAFRAGAFVLRLDGDGETIHGLNIHEE